MVQLPIAGMLPVPKVMPVPPVAILERAPQLLDGAGVACTRSPAGIVTVPLLMSCGDGAGVLSVSVTWALVPANTLLGDTATVMVGLRVPTGAAAPISTKVYETGGCTVTGAAGGDADAMGPNVSVAVSVTVGIGWLYVTTTWQLAPAATDPQVLEVKVNAAELLVGGGTVTATLSALRNVNVCD